MLDHETWLKMHRVLVMSTGLPSGNDPKGDPLKISESADERFDRFQSYAQRIWDMDSETVKVYRWCCGRADDRKRNQSFEIKWAASTLETRLSRIRKKLPSY